MTAATRLSGLLGNLLIAVVVLVSVGFVAPSFVGSNPTALTQVNSTAAALQWTPSGSARTVGGIACATTVITESGSNDVDF